MIPFTYSAGALNVDRVPVADIAAAVGTPFYAYSATGLAHAYEGYRKAFADQDAAIYFAMKANGSLAVLRVFGDLGSGADVVSEGEMRRALAAGIPPERIVFSGVGKSREELAAAIEAGIEQINVESVPELEALSELAAARGAAQRIAIRINPDVDAKTLAKISTGKKENKFGIDLDHALDVFDQARSLPGVEARAVAVHIGSQLTDLGPYEAAFTRIADLVRDLRAAGHEIDTVDLGGGLGIRYDEEVAPDLDAYAALVKRIIGPLGCRVALEPGRSLTGPSGILVARVIYVKQGLLRRFLIVDAAMNDLIRPSLYDAYHPILPVVEAPADAPLTAHDVVGPICESTDTLAVQRPLPPLGPGDLVAFGAAGAYSAVMASTYNARPLVPEVLVDGDRFAVVRRRPSFEDMIRDEALPPWFGPNQPARSAAE